MFSNTWANQEEKQAPLFREYSSIVNIGISQSTPNLIPIKYENSLRINKSAFYRTAVIEEREAGLRQLRDLSLNASVEEHWVFLPEKKLWLELGSDETPGSARIDFIFLKELARKFEKIEVYHIHLRNYLKSFTENGYREIPETWLAVPSFDDIALMIYFSSYFYKYHPGGVILWRICSPLGLTDYLLSNKGILNYMDINENAFLLSYFHPSFIRAINPESFSTFDIYKPHEINNLINWVNDRGKGYIKVKFSS